MYEWKYGSEKKKETQDEAEAFYFFNVYLYHLRGRKARVSCISAVVTQPPRCLGVLSSDWSVPCPLPAVLGLINRFVALARLANLSLW